MPSESNFFLGKCLNVWSVSLQIPSVQLMEVGTLRLLWSEDNSRNVSFKSGWFSLIFQFSRAIILSFELLLSSAISSTLIFHRLDKANLRSQAVLSTGEFDRKQIYSGQEFIFSSSSHVPLALWVVPQMKGHTFFKMTVL